MGKDNDISKCYNKKQSDNNHITAFDMTYFNRFDMTVLFLFISSLSFSLQFKCKVDYEELVIKISYTFYLSVE